MEFPPPGAALTTVTVPTVALTVSVAGTCAVSWQGERYVVARGVPFHCTVEPGTKPRPVTVTRGLLPMAATAGAGGMRFASGFTRGEQTPGGVRVSLRVVSSVDVGAVAAQFGGGGHRFAAGFTRVGSVADVLGDVRAAVAAVPLPPPVG